MPKSKSKSVLLSHSTQHHTHAFGGDTGHTHTHTHADEVAGEIFLLPLTHPGSSFLQDPPGAVGSFSAPGDQVNRPSQSGMDRSVLIFLHVSLLGFLVEETPCEHGENMQTAHRKAQEIAHLSTEGLGRSCPPEPTAPHARIKPMTILL